MSMQFRSWEFQLNKLDSGTVLDISCFLGPMTNPQSRILSERCLHLASYIMNWDLTPINSQSVWLEPGWGYHIWRLLPTRPHVVIIYSYYSAIHWKYIYSAYPTQKKPGRTVIESMNQKSRPACQKWSIECFIYCTQKATSLQVTTYYWFAHHLSLSSDSSLPKEDMCQLPVNGQQWLSS